MSAPTHAMILAAGRGERMRPLTLERAKPALPILGVPLAQRIVRHLEAGGLTHFAMNSHHGAASLKQLLAAELPDSTQRTLTFEPTLMGTGGALLAPREFLARADRFLLHNGDTLVKAPIAALDAAAAESGAIAGLLVRPGRLPGYGAVALRGGQLVGLVRGAAEGPAGTTLATYLGVAVLRRELLERVPVDRPSDLFVDLLLPALGAGGTIRVVPYDGPWLEFTSPERYLRNQLRLIGAARGSGSIEMPGGAVAVTSLPSGALFSSPSARIAGSARLEGSALLDAGAVVGSGAFVRRVVALAGATIGSCSYLEDLVIDAGTIVPPSSLFRRGTLFMRDGRCAFEPFAESA